MAGFAVNGIYNTTHNQSWVGDPDYWQCQANAPGGLPADWQGIQKALMVSMIVSVGGISGGTQTRGWVAEANGSDWHGTNLHGISTGHATWQSWQGLTSAKGFVGGQEFRYGVDQQWGAMYIGRAAVGGRSIVSGAPTGYGWPGYAIGAQIGYWCLPTAPGTAALSSPSTGVLNASWAASSWDGDTPITRYAFDYDTNPGFTTYTRVFTTGTSVGVSGLVGGATYWTRVQAFNAVAEAWGTNSALSGISSIAVQGTPTPPPNPHPIIKVSNGSSWVVADWLKYSQDNAYLFADQHVSVSGAWVNGTT